MDGCGYPSGPYLCDDQCSTIWKVSVSEAAPPLLRRWATQLTQLPVLTQVLLVAGVLQCAALANLAGAFWFLGDDWDPLLMRGTAPDVNLGLWTPHYGNPSPMWVLTYRAVFEVVGLRSYLPYALVTITFHAACCYFLFRILRQLDVPLPVTLGTTWLLLFFGAGKDALLYSASMGHTGAVMLGLAAVLTLLLGNWKPRAVLIALACLLVGLGYSAAGVISVVLVTVFSLIERRWRTAAVLGGLPGVVFLIWYVTVARDQTGSYLPTGLQDLTVVPGFVWRSLTWPLGDAVGLRETGPPLLLGLLIVLVLARDIDSKLWRLAVAGLVSAVAQGVLLGLTRPMMDASTGRYGYVSLVMLLPAVGFAIGAVAARLPLPREVAIAGSIVLLAGYTYVGTQEVRQYAAQIALISSGMEGRVRGIIAASDAGEKILNHDYGDFVNQDLDPALIDSPRIRAALPSRKASATERLDVEVHHMTSVGAKSRVPKAPIAIADLDSFAEPVELAKGCRTYEPTTQRPALTFGTGAGAEIFVTSKSSEVTLQLTRGKAVGPSVTVPIEGSVFISTTAKDAAMFVTFDDANGPYTVCLR